MSVSASQKSSMLSLLNKTHVEPTPMQTAAPRRHASRLVLISKNNNNTTTTASRLNRRELFTSAMNHQQKADNQQQLEKSANFLNGSSTVYVEEIYQSWLADPKSVHKSWDIYFRTNSVQAPPTLGQSTAAAAPSAGAALLPADLGQLVKLLQQQVTGPTRYSSPSLVPSSPEEKLVEDHLKLYALIRSYQIRGHKKANLDPLGIGRFITFLTHIKNKKIPTKNEINCWIETNIHFVEGVYKTVN